MVDPADPYSVDLADCFEKAIEAVAPKIEVITFRDTITHAGIDDQPTLEDISWAEGVAKAVASDTRSPRLYGDGPGDQVRPQAAQLQGRRQQIGYQSCDDSTAQAGAWDSAKCASNGRAYAGNQSVIGVVGTFNSGCAKIIVPVLNRANPGPVAMVSPANTSPGLTTDGPGAEPGEPDKYYPTGKRNYARVVANDQIQGPADAQFAKDIGLKKVFILNDKQTYGFGVATTFKGAAQKLGLQVAGFKGWDAKQSSYEALANAIKADAAPTRSSSAGSSATTARS